MMMLVLILLRSQKRQFDDDPCFELVKKAEAAIRR